MTTSASNVLQREASALTDFEVRTRSLVIAGTVWILENEWIGTSPNKKQTLKATLKNNTETD
jgi:hypothetical protein